jgi:4-amino-4-deoxy-L-arabinose transferase-like glycosyltransferase
LRRIVSILPAWLRLPSEASAKEGRRLESIGTAIVLAFATWYWLRYFNRSTNLLDEGSTAAQALRVLNGELIYRDFFTVVTPGSYYTVAWLFRIFGEQLMVLRWAALVTGIAIALTTLVVARQISAWPFAAAAALMTTVWGWFLVAPNFYSWEAALLSMLALACYLWHARLRADASAGWLIAAGIAAGCAAMVKQNIGAYTAAGLMIAIWGSMLFDRERDLVGKLKTSAQFIAGLAVPVIPTLLWLILSGAGPYLYESWVYYPLSKYPERFARPFPDFFPFSFQDPFEPWVKLVIYLPVVVYPFALTMIGVLSWRFRQQARLNTDATQSKSEGHALLAITAVGALTLLQSWPRADVTHILFGMQPTYILFAYACFCLWRLLTTIPGPRPAIAGVALVMALLPLALFLRKGYQRTDWEYQNYIVPLRTERAAGIFTGGLEAQRIDVVTRYITEHTAPDDFVFVVPWASGFNFLADRSNPTRTDFMLFEDPESYPCLLARLDERPPKYVIYGYTWDVDDKRFRDYAAPIDQYIRSRYAIEFTTDGYEIWRRLAEAPALPGSWERACQPRRLRVDDLF